MTLDDVARYLLQGHIVDLSKKVSPGKAEGPLDTGKRKYEIKMFTYPPGELMHYIVRQFSYDLQLSHTCQSHETATYRLSTHLHQV